MSVFKTLRHDQKEAVGLLQIGTFLEYFDLMLYIHMAVLLNELFFPKTDPHTATILAAFAFCSTFVLRPFGALLFGYIGDHIGRKPTVIITTMMMAISCIIMANLPTYAQIGIASAWLVTGCRIVQGFSSMGEIMGAEIYITEITTPPIQYPAVSFVAVSAAFGTTVALAISTLVTHFGFNWRIAFWVGAAIAVIGSVARTRLRETPEFIKENEKIQKKLIAKNGLGDNKFSKAIKTQKLINTEKFNRKTFWAYLITWCGWPMSFYLVFMYFNKTLKQDYFYTSEKIILHNFVLSIISLIVLVVISILSHKTHPLKILKIRGKISLVLSLLLPIAILGSNSNIQIFLLQTLLLIGGLATSPGVPFFLKHIPTLKRFTSATFIYALSRAVMYIITSFSLVYLTETFNYYGLWLVTVPVSIGFLWGVNHFEKLDKMQNVDQPALTLAA